MSALASDVLVLNRFFHAVRVATVREALTLLFRGAAEVVFTEDESYATYDIDSWLELSQMQDLFEDDGKWIHTPAAHVRIPTIVRLVLYSGFPPRRIHFNRRNLFSRDNGQCQYCGEKRPKRDLTFDHVVPQSRGGQTTWTNIVCACVDCNRRKANCTPREAGMQLIRRPRKPRWSPVLHKSRSSKPPQSWKHFVDEAYWSADLDE